ncbi:MAG TPA: c-type cytochrome [Usitatibacter sp.]|nr:c-type cytochrome [Usitatibacter sp.]
MKAFVRLLAVAGTAGAALGASADDGAMARLARDRGCTLCHHEEPAGPNAVIASAPSWREIAARYRAQPGAEERLAKVVVGGSDPDRRHWKNQAAFASMPANGVETTPEEARELVRWILSFR